MHNFPEKDPDATLDYSSNWTAWLANVADTITSIVVSIESGDAVLGPTAAAHDGNVVTFWLNGGTDETDTVVNVEITTVGGRIDQRTYTVPVRQQ